MTGKRSKLKAITITSATLLLFPFVVKAQTACTVAPYQLQQYINGVNQQANWWYYQGIPQRCGYNTYCQNTMFQQLNYWYQQQSNLVNQWYYQISTQCVGQTPDDGDLPAPSRPHAGRDEIAENATDKITVDSSDTDDVQIVIPRTPQGFRGAQ